MTNYNYNETYTHKIADAVHAAVIEASLSDDRTFAMIRSGEVAKALLMALAAFSATSEAVDTKQKRRTFAEQCAKRLANYIEEARLAPSIMYMPTVALNQIH